MTTEWKLVPVEPTEAQFVAALEARDRSMSDQGSFARLVREIYKAAVAAAPSPWVKTAEQPPTAKDAMSNCVIAIYKVDGAEGVWIWDYIAEGSDKFPYWRPIPKAELPEDV